MATFMQKTQTGLTRIFARFGRKNDRLRHETDRQASHWYDCEVSSRGL